METNYREIEKIQKRLEEDIDDLKKLAIAYVKETTVLSKGDLKRLTAGDIVGGDNKPDADDESIYIKYHLIDAFFSFEKSMSYIQEIQESRKSWK